RSKSKRPAWAERTLASLTLPSTSLSAISAAMAVSMSSTVLCRASWSAFKARCRDTSLRASDAVDADRGGRSLITPVACQLRALTFQRMASPDSVGLSGCTGAVFKKDLDESSSSSMSSSSSSSLDAALDAFVDLAGAFDADDARFDDDLTSMLRRVM